MQVHSPDPGGAPRPRRPWTRSAALLFFSAGLLGADLAFAVRPWISAGLTAAEALLVPPWLAAILLSGRGRGETGGASPAPGRAGRIAALLLALGLLLVCIAEKWLLLLPLPGSTGDPRLIGLYRTYTALAFVLATAGLLGRRPIERLMITAAEHPARLMVLSFGIAALLGSFLLTLPQSLYRAATRPSLTGSSWP